MMHFEEFIAEGKVIKGQKDIQKAKALVKMSAKNIKSAELLEINEVTAATVLTISYEALREIVEAICLTQGYKVFSHEAFTAYLQLLKEEKIAVEFDRYRRLRNGVNYYGKEISQDTAKECRTKVKELAEILKSKYLQFL